MSDIGKHLMNRIGPNGPQSASSSRVCPCCDGAGCSECDDTGQRVRTTIVAGDGLVLNVSGSAVLDDETRTALAEVARLVAAEATEEP